MSEKIRMAFDEAYPQEATTLLMYEAGSVAVNATDCIVPRYRLSAFERGWQSRQPEIDALKEQLRVARELLVRWKLYGEAMMKSGSQLPRHLIADSNELFDNLKEEK